MFSKVLEFKVEKKQGEPAFVCTIISQANEINIFSGNSVQEIFDACVKKFPNGIRPKGIFFTGDNYLKAKSNFCSLVSHGLRQKYFKESDFINYENTDDDHNDVL